MPLRPQERIRESTPNPSTRLDLRDGATLANADRLRYLHTLWLVIERAIKDFGIYELKQKAHGNDIKIDDDFEEIRKRIKDEAEHAALRITGLVSFAAQGEETLM